MAAPIELPNNRFQMLSEQAVTGTLAYSEGVEVETWTQAVVEVYPAATTGDIKVVVEFSNSQPTGEGHWMPDVLDDVTNGVVAGNTLEIPVIRVVRTWNENTPFPIAVPVAHKYLRVGVFGTDGTCSVVVRKGL